MITNKDLDGADAEWRQYRTVFVSEVVKYLNSQIKVLHSVNNDN